MDTKSLFVGLLLGVALCLLVVFFMDKEAKAAAPIGQVRFQMTEPGDNNYVFVINQGTGDVYRLLERRGKWSWNKIATGPPR